MDSGPITVPDITLLLSAWRDGDDMALNRLTPHVYEEPRRMAHKYLRSESPGHLLQPTVLVNEVFIRLLEWKPGQWNNRSPFFGVSANVMRRILVKFAHEN